MSILDELESIGLGPPCPNCGQPTDWLPCWKNCNNGYFTYEDHLQYEDPLWYQPSDVEMCDECQGQGGWWRCWDCQECFDNLKSREEEELCPSDAQE